MKVLVIGNVRPGHKALVKMGHQITVLMKKSHGHEPDIKFPYENLILLDDDTSFDTYIDIAAALHERIGFERMACFNDTYQEIAALVANKTGISYPHNQTLERVDLLCTYFNQPTWVATSTQRLMPQRFGNS